MARYMVLYKWYDTAFCGYTEADSENMAKIQFIIAEIKYRKAHYGYLTSDLLSIDTDEPLKPQIRAILNNEIADSSLLKAYEIKNKTEFWE